MEYSVHNVANRGTLNSEVSSCRRNIYDAEHSVGTMVGHCEEKLRPA